MATDIKYIKSLLEKYYEGMTTPEEEKTLTEFFSEATDVPEEMEADRKMFAALSDTSLYAETPSDLDTKIMAAVDNAIAVNKKPGRKRFSWIAMTSIAAAAAVVIVLLTMMPYPTDITMEADNAALAQTETTDTPDSQTEEISESVVTHTGNEIEEIKAEEPVKEPSRAIKRMKKRTLASSTTATATDSVNSLTEEELRTLRAGMKALTRARKSIAQASELIESADRGLKDIYSTIQDKLN